MLKRFALLTVCCLSLFAEEHVYLKTPNLSSENIIGTNVGIRPTRKHGMRIEPEYIKDKLVIHNYGFGGSGLTLSFGASQEVVNILKNEKPAGHTIAVLGAGVIGLATAYDLVQHGYEVNLYAKDWSPHLTSNVAAGIWSPMSIAEDAPESQKLLNARIHETSKNRFYESIGNNPEFSGVRLLASYSFGHNSTDDIIKTKHKGEPIIAHFDNGVVKEGKRVYEIGIDGKIFIQDLFSKVKSKGVKLIEKQFNCLDDILGLNESIVINCTSMGSRTLFNDQNFIPVRGEIIYFKPQEGVDYLFYQQVPNSSAFWVSVYPWSDRLILGGVYEKGEEAAVIQQDVINTILNNAERCLSGEF